MANGKKSTMAYHLTPERLKLEITEYLANDRLPERRIWATSNVLEKPDSQSTPEDFRKIYDKAKKFDEWPGDSWREPIGFKKNPFLRQTKNLSLAAIILSDPDRQKEAFDKMLEAGYTEQAAKEVLSHYHAGRTFWSQDSEEASPPA
jgi:hypothetical protein